MLTKDGFLFFNCSWGFEWNWYFSNIKIKAAPNELKDGSAQETEETRKLRKTELEQKIREIRKLDQQKKSDAQLEYQVLLGMQSKERKLKDDVEAMNLEKIKKKEEFEMSKLKKVLEDAQDKLKNSSIYEESVKQQKNSVSKSMNSLTLNLTEGEAERRNLEELENKKKEGDFKSRSNLDEEHRRAERRSASPVFPNTNTLIPLGCPPFLEGRNVHWDRVRVGEEEKDLDKNDLRDSSKESKQNESLDFMKKQFDDMIQSISQRK